METISDEAVAAGSPPVSPNAGLRALALIALLAIVLGLTIQLLIVLARVLAGGPVPGLGLAADLAQGVTWSFLVCTGVGIGTSIMRVRGQIVGLLGLIFAPVAVALAKGTQRLVASMLELAEQQALLSLGTVSLLRAAEYAVLGFLLGTLAYRGERRLFNYLAAGAAVGVVLGGSVVALQAWLASTAGTPLGLPQIAAAVVNEVLFPIGCALVIYCGQMVGRSFSRTELALT